MTTREDELRDQAAKARRLAGGYFDPLTVKLLQEFADECEKRARRMTPIDDKHAEVPKR